MVIQRAFRKAEASAQQTFEATSRIERGLAVSSFLEFQRSDLSVLRDLAVDPIAAGEKILTVFCCLRWALDLAPVYCPTCDELFAEHQDFDGCPSCGGSTLRVWEGFES